MCDGLCLGWYKQLNVAYLDTVIGSIPNPQNVLTSNHQIQTKKWRYIHTCSVANWPYCYTWKKHPWHEKEVRLSTNQKLAGLLCDVDFCNVIRLGQVCLLAG